MYSLKILLYNKARHILRSSLSSNDYIRLRMVAAGLLWKLHRKDISQVMGMLEDGHSRDTLRAYMKFCTSWNPDRLLKFTRPSDKQYFDEHVFRLNRDGSETFVDVGVYDGSNSFQFAEETNYKYDHILLFEPDKASYENSRQNIENMQLKNALIFNEGCYDHDGKVRFSNNGTSGEYVSNNGSHPFVNVVSLDRKLRSLKEVNNITYIKMDVEGSEYKALQGCAKTIRKYKPRLAISLYHKPEDIYVLPVLIKKILPEYKLYIRHYNSHNIPSMSKTGDKALTYELVCYALA